MRPKRSRKAKRSLWAAKVKCRQRHAKQNDGNIQRGGELRHKDHVAAYSAIYNPRPLGITSRKRTIRRDSGITGWCVRDMQKTRQSQTILWLSTMITAVAPAYIRAVNAFVG